MFDGPITLTAKAKLNLYLHVGKLKLNGRHDLISQVAFASAVFDVLRLSLSDKGTDSLVLDGPFGHLVEVGSKNLVLRAIDDIRALIHIPPLALQLTKNIPVQAGLGGGSADAAAIYRWATGSLGVDEIALLQSAAKLGGDVPVCIRSTASLMEGEGERVTPKPLEKPMFVLLANPGVACPTGTIFSLMDAALGGRMDLNAVDKGDGFRHTRNDLQPFAIQYNSLVRDCLDTLVACKNAIFVRMAGSGATCFAAFDSEGDAQSAFQTYRDLRPTDWCAISRLE